MMNRSPVVISAAVEGGIDEAVVRSLIHHVGASPGPVYVKNGKASLLKSVKNYDQAAHRRPWIVLVDLDRDEECAHPFAPSGFLPPPPSCASESL